MQEGRPTQGARVGEGLRSLRGVEDQLNGAVLDRVDDVRPPFRHFVIFWVGMPFSTRNRAVPPVA